MALGRFFLFFGLVALLSLAGAGLAGYGAFGPPADTQLVHSGLAFVAALSAVFANGWLVLFLAGSGRWLRRLAGGREGGGAPLAEAGDAARAARAAIVVALLATVGIVAAFLTGNLSYGSTSWRLGHHLLSIASLALQAGALWLERRALAADDRLAAALDAGAPGTLHAA